ncbi:MAG TPA: LysM peptidoglycan-binding domain-containing protein [Pseudomonas xinjiangensis]|uniref:LysM peptidoglycan-binding domain-containing protein n=2 Tax=root TaxID=1 RepID=A0A7V1FTA9_9GAMM|nr:LysM peptidoglycan-binding domain-containing protein [Halopseudomonas xinjiangensis]HEC47273.1 LysM peptidoglycan-binding domain-containing protein [Halopseudomonas xinjiangensis]
MRKTLLGLLLLTTSFLAQAQESVFKEGHPETYRVVKGDTLWDISGRFLSLPWKWPEIWHANPQIDNPHLIYPGDMISLIYVDGQPRLTVNRGQGGTIVLSPTVRSSPVAEAIPTIPLEAINAFLDAGRILDDPATIESAPYVIGGQAQSVVAGAGSRVYARGEIEEGVPSFGIYRRGKSYSNAETGEFLGLHIQEIGNGKVMSTEGDITTLNISRSNQEVRIGDRLLKTEERPVTSTFFPSDPEEEINGLILDVPNGVTQIGQYDVVILNKGAVNGLEEGNVLAIYKTGEIVRDRIQNQQVQLPDERAGMLMVFRVYEKMSYGIVLYASRPLAIMDKVRNP